MELKAYFDGLVETLGRKVAEKKTARRVFAYETGRIGRKLFDPAYTPAWTNVFLPFEILTSMDVGAVFIEFVGAMLAGTGQSQLFVQGAVDYGLPADGCSYHRALTGASLQNLLGRPEILIGTTSPCDGGLKTIQNLARRLNVELFTLDIPYPPVTREKIDYLVGQYRGMIAYVERRSGRKHDPERLREAARLSNEATRIVRRLYELCKSRPAPITSDTLRNFQIVFSLLMGTPEGVETARVFLDEAEAHAANGCAGLPPEKFRLMWIQNRIQFKNNLVTMMEERFGAKIVIDELNYIYWDDLDEDNPLEGLALRLISHPLNGPADGRIAILKKLAKEYAVDGAVNPANWGCRQNCGARLVMQDTLRDAGVPVINLDVDCVDPSNYFEGQLLTRIQSFMEMLER
jgi:benzoyl-CoA reductase/2-hydroxyglutaryl-CoA dehydratase subunit BcrC/BadD/HgdB